MMEPYRIKVVEPLRRTTLKERSRILQEVGYNLFMIPARYVYLDFISDSGTGAMSSHAWARMIEAEEDFSGQKAGEDFIKTARKITGFPFIQPVHQGRTAENILFNLLFKKGDKIFSNTHFETTRANLERIGCKVIDIPDFRPPFCGNIDLQKLESTVKREKKLKAVILTLTNNVKGGQPVSIENIKETYRIVKKKEGILIFDASRFADNAFFIKRYTNSKKSILEICQEMFEYCDILYLSSKKDGLVNIGGFIGVRDEKLYEKLREKIIEQESYPSSGGLAARDLAAMAVGLEESIEEEFLRSHIEKVNFLGHILKENGVKIFEPIGGHGVIIIPRHAIPYSAYTLGAEIYLHTGIRGGVFGDEFRLAVPRRVYTSEHLRFTGERISVVYKKCKPAFILKLANRPRTFFNFFARFKAVKGKSP
ncbi:MAG: tryptophanase [candidate division WOR-3 bacterium]|nr:tryptophanase [candidate division WOR-3 bacterium]